MSEIYVQDPNDSDPTCPHDYQICMDCGSVLYIAPHVTEEGTFSGTTAKTIHVRVQP